MESNRPSFNSPFANGFNSSSPTPSWLNLTPSVSGPPPAAGRKRSRDEAAINLEDDYFTVQQPTTAPPENEDEWEYGEGMTLIKPSGDGYIPAGSQTGTWAEEKLEEQVLAPIPERPIIRSAKSQRLDFTSTPAVAEEVLSNGTLVTPTSAGSPTNGQAEPAVDDFTRHLGIGWRLISDDEDIQAAARGWTRFINNHYPVTDAKIRLQSNGLASYLVEANEGYFLFGEDLKQGRMVSTSLEKTLANLQGPVPIFDGDGIMETGETLKLNADPTSTADGGHAGELTMNELEGGLPSGNHAQTLEVEMDMS